MSRKTLVLGSCLAAFFVAGCQEQATAPVAATPTLSPSFSRSAGASRSDLLQALVNRGPLALPSSVVPVSRVFGDAGRPAIDPGDYVCSDASPVVDVVNAEIDRTIAAGELPQLITILQRWGDLIPTYDALYFTTSATPQTYGYKGAFTKQIVKVERDIKRFWDIASSDIQVVAMHGSMMLDVPRTARTLELIGFSPASALQYAKDIRAALLSAKTLNGGNYAYFTFNAFALSDPDGFIPDKIVMGDGILEAYAAIGLGDIAPQAIFAHEFAHHIQYENEYFNDPVAGPTEPEKTRYTELMADAYAAYFLTHARGAAMNQKRVVKFLEIFYQIGDCAFDNDGHHGTPNQRMAAAEWGFELADQAQKQGHILSTEAFHTLFVAAYPSLVAPDAP